MVYSPLVDMAISLALFLFFPVSPPQPRMAKGPGPTATWDWDPSNDLPVFAVPPPPVPSALPQLAGPMNPICLLALVPVGIVLAVTLGLSVSLLYSDWKAAASPSAAAPATAADETDREKRQFWWRMSQRLDWLTKQYQGTITRASRREQAYLAIIDGQGALISDLLLAVSALANSADPPAFLPALVEEGESEDYVKALANYLPPPSTSPAAVNPAGRSELPGRGSSLPEDSQSSLAEGRDVPGTATNPPPPQTANPPRAADLLAGAPGLWGSIYADIPLPTTTPPAAGAEGEGTSAVTEADPSPPTPEAAEPSAGAEDELASNLAESNDEEEQDADHPDEPRGRWIQQLGRYMRAEDWRAWKRAARRAEHPNEEQAVYLVEYAAKEKEIAAFSARKAAQDARREARLAAERVVPETPEEKEERLALVAERAKEKKRRYKARLRERRRAGGDPDVETTDTSGTP
ncbi:hypothetical protein BJ546DRAFT_157615 [Cryomyces antarcticus]